MRVPIWSLSALARTGLGNRLVQIDQSARSVARRGPNTTKPTKPDIELPQNGGHRHGLRRDYMCGAPSARQLSDLGKLRGHQMNAARQVLKSLGYPDSRLPEWPFPGGCDETRSVTPADMSSFAENSRKLTNLVVRLLREKGYQKGKSLEDAKTLLKATSTALLNGQQWEPVTTYFSHSGRGYQSKLTPAGQMKLGKCDVFEKAYHDRGVCSASTKETDHATNLWLSELHAIDGSDSGPPLFKGIRHGVLSPYGIADAKERHEGALRRAKEVVTAALFSQPDKLRRALDSGEPVTLRLASCALLTPGAQGETSMLRDQIGAWQELVKHGNPITLTVHDENGKPRNVRVNLHVVAFNFGVNEFALKLGMGHRVSDKLNEPALAILLGDLRSPEIGGWVGNYLQAQPLYADRVRAMALELKAIWAQRAHHRDGGEPYKAAQRVAMLAYEIGAVPCWNCKSGKDRTGMLDAEIKRAAIAQYQCRDSRRPQDRSDPDMRKLFQTVLVAGGNLEVQQYNTAAPGSKVLKTLPFGSLLNLSYREHIGAPNIWREAQGFSRFV